MKRDVLLPLILCLTVFAAGCKREESSYKTTNQALEINSENSTSEAETMIRTGEYKSKAYTKDTKISDVIADPAFKEFGRLIFPVDSGYYGGDTLGNLHLTWYSHIDASKTVEIANYLKEHAKAGETCFYDIYTDEEKAADPAKKNTGLFFFKGESKARFAICNAGGGFAYVGAMHDSFPHAEELEVNTDCYSLWGGSAGGRMTAYLSSYETKAFGGGDYPRPGTAVIQYTGHSEYTRDDPPTYMCVGENDGIASWRTMQARAEALKSAGIDVEFHKYPGLGHGFGLGTGTAAEGWFEDAVAFWEKQM